MRPPPSLKRQLNVHEHPPRTALPSSAEAEQSCSLLLCISSSGLEEFSVASCAQRWCSPRQHQLVEVLS